METFTQAYHPSDPQYAIKRQRQLKELSSLSTPQLKRMVQSMLMNPMPEEAKEQNTQVAKSFVSQLHDGAMHPALRRSILDSTGGGTSGGSVMIRQDLEVPLYLLFVRNFPLYERIEAGPANGLTLLAPAA